MSKETPYLSLVAVSRNDDHGGNTLERTQVFVDGFFGQCERHQLAAELILVEWNPPSEKPPLAEALSWARSGEWAEARVITVPHTMHSRLTYADRLPLFQMIGKNVGIRRARGEFVLATNIDILFSEELFKALASRELRTDRTYRCDRWDAESGISSPEVSDKLSWAREHLVRKNRRVKPWELDFEWDPDSKEDVPSWINEVNYFSGESVGGTRVLVTGAEAPHNGLHLNACGDFTLLHRDGWERVGGYAEFETYSLHIDSLGVLAAHYSGFQETWFEPPAVCFHIEHSLGSGYTEVQASSLFERLSEQGIGWLDYQELKLLFLRMQREQDALQFNGPNWGFPEVRLREVRCGEAGKSEVFPGSAENFDSCRGALNDEYEPLRLVRNSIREFRAETSENHATLMHGVNAYRTAFEDAEVRVQQLADRIEMLEAQMEASGASHAASREAMAARLEKTVGFLTDSRAKIEELRTHLKEKNEELGRLALRLRVTSEHLAAYRQVFGGLERFGWFRK